MKSFFKLNFYVCTVMIFFCLKVSSLNGQGTLFVLSNSTDSVDAAYFFKKLNSIDTTLLNKTELANYFFRKSSAEAYKNNSVNAENLLKKSFKKDSIWFCKKINLLLNHFRTNKTILANKKTFFIDDISEKVGNRYLSNCQICCKEIKTPKKSKLLQVENMKYSERLEALIEQDQKYRTEDTIIWKIQDKIDFKNRKILDSLYHKYDFPSLNKVSKNAQHAAWLILHHSTDCEWNEKWIIRFLDAYKRKEIEGGFLSQTITRFYHPTGGFCEEEKRKTFISLLTNKYPKEYGDLFGYNAY